MSHSKRSTLPCDPLTAGTWTTQRMVNAALEFRGILQSCFQDVSRGTRFAKHNRRHYESKRARFQGEARTKYSMSIIRTENDRASDDKSCMAECRICQSVRKSLQLSFKTYRHIYIYVCRIRSSMAEMLQNSITNFSKRN